MRELLLAIGTKKWFVYHGRGLHAEVVWSPWARILDETEDIAGARELLQAAHDMAFAAIRERKDLGCVGEHLCAVVRNRNGGGTALVFGVMLGPQDGYVGSPVPLDVLGLTEM